MVAKHRSRLVSAGLLAGVALAFACANGDAEPVVETAASDLPLTFCTDPRPQMCTHEYRPACGHRCDSPPCEDRRTYGNACTACSDARVSATTPGTCEDGPPERRPKLR